VGIENVVPEGAFFDFPNTNFRWCNLSSQ